MGEKQKSERIVTDVAPDIARKIDLAIKQGYARSRADFVRIAIQYYLQELGLIKSQIDEDRIKKLIRETIKEIFENQSE